VQFWAAGSAQFTAATYIAYSWTLFGAFFGPFEKNQKRGPKVIEYLGKMAVRTTSLGPKMAVGSSPVRATNSDHLMLTDDLNSSS
jgi:hypothetical protein